MSREVEITISSGSCYPETDKYLGLLKWLGIEQQQREIIESVPRLEEMRIRARDEYARINEGHYE